VLHAAPLSHGSGLYGLPHFAVGAVNVIPESGHFEPQEIFALLDHWQNISFFAAPTMIVRLLSSASARPPRHLRTLIYGGAPMYVADSLRAIQLFGQRLYQLYGQGEAPMTITGLPQEMHQASMMDRLSSCGYARTGCEVKIYDDVDRELPSGEEVVAFVVAKTEVSNEELDKLCLDNIARFKRPREYRFVEALPKNNYGKVLKTELRKLLAPLTP